MLSLMVLLGHIKRECQLNQNDAAFFFIAHKRVLIFIYIVHPRTGHWRIFLLILYLIITSQYYCYSDLVKNILDNYIRTDYGVCATYA